MNNVLAEIFLSTVLGKTVISPQGQEIGKLWDLIMVPGEVFPEVSHLLVKSKRRIISIPWHRISLFNRFVISVSGPSHHLPEYAASREGEILVKRDILDKQIVDVNGAKVVRVNDLKLGSYKDHLCIFFVDIGFRGLLRRLGYEQLGEKLAVLLNRQLPHQHISWEYVQLLEMNLSRLTLTVAREQMQEMHPADLAQIISQIPSKNIQAVLNSLDVETAGEAIHELEPELRSRVISQLDSEQASDILEEMDPDEAADVLGDLPEEKAQELLGLMDEEEAEDIQELMEHEEDTAGGLMNSEFLFIAANLTVEEALQQVKILAPEVETVYYIYIVEPDEALSGVVTLKDLLINPPHMPIAELMTTNLKTVTVESSPEDVLEIIAKYNLIAVPVLDKEAKMAGIVTVDDILELFLPYALRRKRHRHH
jgi:flagellar motility protein MotE (MotC chaperone)/sporulation protein YlmC with PRC-barrel domain